MHSFRPDIRQAAIDEISKLIGSQYEGMSQTYKAGTGADLPVQKYVSPAGIKWMQSKGINAAPTAAAPAAAVPANVQAVLSSAGPGVHTLSDGSKWLKAADGTITQQK